MPEEPYVLVFGTIHRVLGGHTCERVPVAHWHFSSCALETLVHCVFVDHVLQLDVFAQQLCGTGWAEPAFEYILALVLQLLKGPSLAFGMGRSFPNTLSGP